jgi:hypothetical protein
MKTPWYQRLSKLAGYALLAILGFGAFLDTIVNSRSLITIPYAVAGTACIAGGLLLVRFALPIDWRATSGELTQINKINIFYYSAAFGLVVLFWLAALSNYGMAPAPKKDMLTPDDQIVPISPCNFPISENGITLYLGTNAVFFDSDVLDVVEIDNEKLLTINRVGDSLTVDSSIFSEDGRVVATIERNNLKFNYNNLFYVDRDLAPSVYAVIDQKNRVALRVSFLNHRTIRVEGIFRYGSGPEIVIDDRFVRIGKRKYWDNCFQRPGNFFALFPG